MKKTLLTLITLFITIATFAQAPDLINYQAIIRDSGGSLVSEGNIGMQVSILQTTATGTAVYTETHTTTTNTNGLITIMIGGGTTTGNFAAIDWSNGPYFIKTETDVTGGANYTIVGTSQLLSVPYALYAKNGTKFTEATEGLEYDGGDITLTQPGATIKLTSPDGTVYELGVNDNGQLSVPTSNTSATTPTNFYLYGSFNNWDAANALQFGYGFSPYAALHVGVKYFDAGTEIKFLAAQNESIVYGGNSFSNGTMVENGNAITIPSNGLYRIIINTTSSPVTYQISSIGISFAGDQLSYGTDGSGDFFPFRFLPNNQSVSGGFTVGGNYYGDNLNDLSLEHNGSQITTPASAIAIRLDINFNSSMNYQYIY